VIISRLRSECQASFNYCHVTQLEQHVVSTFHFFSLNILSLVKHILLL